MWLFTSVGFFSIVQKPGTEFLTIRARAAGDLDHLRARYLKSLTATTTAKGTDYPFRATATHAAVAEALGQIVRDVTYANFKDHIKAVQGAARARAYGEVWGALLDLRDGERTPDRSEAP